MAKKDGVSPDMNAVAKGQRTACELWSADPSKRIKQIEAYRKALVAERDAIAAAKEAAKNANHADTLKDDLIKKGGWNKTALACYTKVANITDIEERSRAARQCFEAWKDAGILVPELFDEAAFGVGTADVKGESAGFDGTSEGRRRGGKKAQPPVQQRSTEQMAASNKPREIPQGPKTYEEIVAAFEAENKKWEDNGSKPGRKPKAYVEAKEALDAANAEREAGGESTTEAAPPPPAAEAAAEPPPPPADNVVKLPTAKAGEVSAGIKEGTKQGDAALAASIEASKKKAASDKPKTSRKPKDAAPPPPAPEPEPAASDDDDDDDPSFPAGPVPPERIGDRANTGRIA